MELIMTLPIFILSVIVAVLGTMILTAIAITLKGFQIFEPIRNEIGSIEKFKDQHVDSIIEKIDKQIDLLIGKIPEVPVKKIEDYVLKKKKH
jgi:hypothetical protein